MELSKMGPPLNSSTATISLRRRPESFRAAASGAAVESWLILLSPPRWSRLLGCVAPARFPSVLHESPAVDSQDRNLLCREMPEWPVRHPAHCRHGNLA